jgi:hypothetical protein
MIERTFRALLESVKRLNKRMKLNMLRSRGLPSMYSSVAFPGMLKVNHELMGRELAISSHAKGAHTAFETGASSRSNQNRHQIPRMVTAVARSEII